MEPVGISRGKGPDYQALFSRARGTLLTVFSADSTDVDGKLSVEVVSSGPRPDVRVKSVSDSEKDYSITQTVTLDRVETLHGAIFVDTSSQRTSPLAVRADESGTRLVAFRIKRNEAENDGSTLSLSLEFRSTQDIAVSLCGGKAISWTKNGWSTNQEAFGVLAKWGLHLTALDLSSLAQNISENGSGFFGSSEFLIYLDRVTDIACHLTDQQWQTFSSEMLSRFGALSIWMMARPPEVVTDVCSYLTVVLASVHSSITPDLQKAQQTRDFLECCYGLTRSFACSQVGEGDSNILDVIERRLETLAASHEVLRGSVRTFLSKAQELQRRGIAAFQEIPIDESQAASNPSGPPTAIRRENCNPDLQITALCQAIRPDDTTRKMWEDPAGHLVETYKHARLLVLDTIGSDAIVDDELSTNFPWEFHLDLLERFGAEGFTRWIIAAETHHIPATEDVVTADRLAEAPSTSAIVKGISTYLSSGRRLNLEACLGLPGTPEGLSKSVRDMFFSFWRRVAELQDRYSAEVVVGLRFHKDLKEVQYGPETPKTVVIGSAGGPGLGLFTELPKNDSFGGYNDPGIVRIQHKTAAGAEYQVSHFSTQFALPFAAHYNIHRGEGFGNSTTRTVGVPYERNDKLDAFFGDASLWPPAPPFENRGWDNPLALHLHSHPNLQWHELYKIIYRGMVVTSGKFGGDDEEREIESCDPRSSRPKRTPARFANELSNTY